jgi:hypothetical protein
MFCFEMNKVRKGFLVDCDMSKYIKDSTNKYLETYSMSEFNILTHQPTRLGNVGLLIAIVGICSFFTGYKLNGYKLQQQ